MYKRNCPDCGKELEYSDYKKHWQALNRNSVCRSCRTVRANKSPNRDMTKENNPAFKGYKDIPYQWFKKYFTSGKRKRSGDVTMEQVYDIWLKQNKKCALSGLPIDWEYNSGWTCSLDRIDSNKEYTIDNVQLVHKDINVMKHHYEESYFIEMCKLIVNHNEAK